MTQQILINSSIELAKNWQSSSTGLHCDFDKEFYIKINKMLDHPKNNALLKVVIKGEENLFNDQSVSHSFYKYRTIGSQEKNEKEII